MRDVKNMLLVPALLLVVAVCYDLKSRTIPDWIAAAILVWGVVTTAVGAIGASWGGLAIGLAVGSGLGLALFRWGRFGGADAKLIAALGAAVGPIALLDTVFWMALVGGLLALVAVCRGQRDFAYAPAIAAGLLIHTIRSGEWTHVL